ncbi:hypothetical protein GMDG_03065 [Pseudogymnoascus destructans 20631-21]|uniref:UDP-glucose:glycoprotein glucosyltransferase n=1 Tax=Pseudogymnoascus destructans (strain ATCC MYA-4855 / 20631-21) TaxID=658429 RepID=L8G5Z5_PSED2|nr:hypothetical protein GMDG_03065 [Pseudogymnoascus destructans 20631-21]
MVQFGNIWSLTGNALAFSCLQSIKVSASPTINVALATSFTSAPYLLELLETAGDENSTSYFPLLDRIAEGYFKDARTDLEQYNSFVKVLRDDGHLDSEGLASYSLALSLRTSAPRIEAQYQFYDTAIEPSGDDSSCPVWVLFGGKKHCSPALDGAHGYNGRRGTEQLQFDRITGNLSAPPSILYADITSSEFNQFHKKLIQKAQNQEISYRIRHKKPNAKESKPLVIGGYGVELALKRTDYIVIDDREAEAQVQEESIKMEVVLEDEELADLKPLSASELASLGLKASSFIMQSENPFEVLTRLSQDFPRYSSAIAAHNVSSDFAEEHLYNRGQLVPAGANVVWINGLQVPTRQMDSFSMLDILRKERKLLNKFSQLGLTGSQTISLLSHKDIAFTKADDEPARFDWRDDGDGDVIIWLNNIEKDKRYDGWPATVRTLLQGGYPGQLPQVRKDLFNLVFPVDLSNIEDVELVVTQLSGFVKRALPLRFGLVPLTNSNAALEQAMIVYYLLDSYGLSTMVAYLNGYFASKGTKSSRNANFEAAIEERKLLGYKVAKSLEEVLDANEANGSIAHSKQWNFRLGANEKVPSVFVNGAAVPRDENWMQGMSQRVQMDLRLMQRAVFENTVTDDHWPPMLYLHDAASGRNPFLMPENDKDLQLFDVNAIYSDHAEALDGLPVVKNDPSAVQDDWAQMILIADVKSTQGKHLLTAAAEFTKRNPSVELVIVPSSETPAGILSVYEYMTARLFQPLKSDGDLDRLVETVSITAGDEERQITTQMSEKWSAIEGFLGSLGLRPGQQGLLLNGRLVGPILSEIEMAVSELEQLLGFERTKRIRPVLAAVKALGISEAISDPLASSKLTSLVTLSFISNVPEGIFEQASTLRIDSFKAWKSEYTAIEIGDESTASIHIQVALDPASQESQRWIPILKVLSELNGVYLKLFLNPKDILMEIPIKRFYRYVLESKPLFNADGSLKDIKAQFASVPQEALLTVGMDVPAPWLVAPKQSVTDLDNIKLSSVNGDVNAVYELQHILIEGHSSDKETGQAPRGAQLLLGTAADAHFADTIIMANLGYFQFKANPGFYKINLQEGPSSKIYSIDTLGASLRDATKPDETTEISLISFQGLTLFPQLSRNPGQETEDVLEPTTDLKDDILSKGRKLAQNILGLGKKSTAVQTTPQAEINIFSVASGHLYERMLNIMMVSVMKHTNHTVKFWFIEQFLSPSFKQSIPSLAAAYNFDYEMVTYKWPHWLRSQSEKQREIWGYKILFLDVLFPLSLDKVIFVDADQIVRTDMRELVDIDLQGAPYGFTPMCDSRAEMEGFRFWKQGYWKSFLRGLPYHISALYVVDLRRFREIAAGDRLRQQYHQLSADPASLANLDQDLPNHMQAHLPIYSLPQEWLWCETWCSDESLGGGKDD